jgi:hypothetical protein
LQRGEGHTIEAATEVAGRSRVGNPLGPEQVQIGLVLPPQFEVLQTRSGTQRVVRQAEHMIRLLIRKIELEEV